MLTGTDVLVLNLIACLVVIVVAGLSAEIVRAGFQRRATTPVANRRTAGSRADD